MAQNPEDDWIDGPVPPGELVWGHLRKQFCTDCFFTHYVANAYVYGDNPMWAEFLGEVNLCDEDDEDEE